MNKKIIKTLMLIWILVCGFQQVVYADVTLITYPIENESHSILLGIFMGTVIVLILALSFLATFSSKKQVNQENEKSFVRLFSINPLMFFVGILMVILVIATIFLIINNYDILFKKRVGTQIFEEKNYYYPFSKYIETFEDEEKVKKITDIEGLINELKRYNRKGNNSKIIYLNNEYKTSNELDEFLEEINNNKANNSYYVKIFKQSSDDDNKKDDFSLWISQYYYRTNHKTAYTYVDPIFYNAEGNVSGSVLKSVLMACKGFANYNYEEHPERIPSISYNSISGEKDHNSSIAAYIVNVKEDGTKEIIDGGYAPIGADGKDSITKYDEYIDSIVNGLDFKHRYNVIYTGNSDGMIAGMTINYDRDNPIENFTQSTDLSALHGVVSTTGLEIDCLR